MLLEAQRPTGNLKYILHLLQVYRQQKLDNVTLEKQYIDASTTN